MVSIGGEFGTVTGRKRRCGWLDLVALKYAARVNGLTDIALTKLDVLSHFDTLRVAVAYESRGERHAAFPRSQRVLYDCEPVYEDLPGWGEDISTVRSYHDLPAEARDYVEFVEDQTGTPISIVSVGADREATLMRG